MMGREVRRVPANWEHPKHWTGGVRGPEQRYKPLFPGEDYQGRVDEWDAECAQWKAGKHPDQCEDNKGMFYEQWAGQRPHRDDYMPNWPDAERTHLMMYEDTTEGTPISPAFAAAEELARWLADNGASAFGRETATYEQWLSTINRGWAISAVMDSSGMRSGVAALAEDE